MAQVAGELEGSRLLRRCSGLQWTPCACSLSTRYHGPVSGRPARKHLEWKGPQAATENSKALGI